MCYNDNMPSLPAVTSTIMVALNMSTGLGSPQVTRFFTTYTGTAPTVAQANTFAAAISTAWGTNVAPLKNANGGLLSVDVVDLSSPTSAVGSHVGTVSGSRAGTEPEASISMVSSYTIGRRYRGGHPRGYWPLGSTADIANPRTWAGAFVTAVDTGLAAFFTAVNAAGWTGAGTLTHSNVSYYSGFTVVTSPTTGRARNVPKLRVGGPTIDTVTAINARSSVGLQRRRTAFVD